MKFLLDKIANKKTLLWAPAIPALILSSIILVGWATNNRDLISLYLPPPFLVANTTLCFIFTCLSMIGICLSLKRLPMIFAIIPLIISSLTLMEYIFSINIGIDELLFTYKLPDVAKFPGRPGINTAACFFFLAVTLLLTAKSYQHSVSIIAEIFSATAFVIGSVSLFYYVFQISPSTNWTDTVISSLHASIGINTIALCLFLYHSLLARNEAKFFLAPLIGFVFFTAATVFILIQTFSAQRQLALYTLAQTNANYIADDLKASLLNRNLALSRMANRIEVLGSYTDPIWNVDVIGYLKDFPSLYIVTLYNKDFGIENQSIKKNFSPKENNQLLIKEMFQNAQKNERLSFFYQLSNQDMIFVFPIYHANGSFGGILAAELSLPVFLQEALPNFFFDYFNITIEDNKSLLYQKLIPNTYTIGNEVSSTITTGFLDWKVKIFPTNKALPLIRNFLLLFSLLTFGFTTVIIVMLFLIIAVYLSRRAKINISMALKEKNETLSFLQAILNGSNYSIISTTPEGIITSFNKAAEKMLLWKGEELIGKFTPGVFHDPKEMEEQAKILSKTLGTPISPKFEVFIALPKKGLPYEAEWTYIRKDGTRFPVKLSISAIHDQNGAILGFLGIANDVTSVHEVEALKANLLSITSHELRSPLTAIKGSLDLLHTHEAIPSEDKQLIEVARKNCDHLIRLTTDLLDSQKLEAGKMTFTFTDLSLRDLLNKAYEFNNPLAEKYQLHLEKPENIPDLHISGDEDRLVQVLTNFVSNAVKHSDKESTISFIVTQIDKVVRIGVQDHGPGLPKEFQIHAFEKFSQATMKKGEKKEGSGLGLYITKLIIENHQGKIGVDSTDSGCVFWIELPIITT